MLKDKYVVFKKEEFDKWIQTGASGPASGDEPESLADHFVLRSKDVFAAPALHGYGHTIQSMLDVDAVLRERTGRGLLTEDQRESFGQLADDIVMLALEWQRRVSKLPD